MKNNYLPNLRKMPLSAVFDALSDPARIKIIQLLLEEDELSCGECKSGLSKSTMSHHFKVLREAGLIQRREEGKVHFISLRIEEIEIRLPGLLEMIKASKAPF